MRCLRETLWRAIAPVSLVLACGTGAAACERPSGTPEPTPSLLGLGVVDDLASSPDLSVMHGWTRFEYVCQPAIDKPWKPEGAMKLNTMGAQGWEFIQQLPSNPDVFCFKRGPF